MNLLVAPLVLTLSVSPANRAPSINCQDKKPHFCTSALYTGNKAPFEGVLLTTPYAAELFVLQKNFEKRLKLETGKLKEMHKLELKYTKAVHKIELDAEKEKIARAEKQIEEMTLSWYEKPSFIVPVVSILGTLLGIGLTIGTARIVEARK